MTFSTEIGREDESTTVHSGRRLGSPGLEANRPTAGMIVPIYWVRVDMPGLAAGQG